jgi:hypothetical protein
MAALYCADFIKDNNQIREVGRYSVCVLSLSTPTIFFFACQFYTDPI